MQSILRMIEILFVFYFILAHGKCYYKSNFLYIYSSFLLTEIQMSHALVCYSCSGGQVCGTLFSPNSNAVKRITSDKNEPLSSCSVRLIMPDTNVYIFFSFLLFR